MSNVSDDLKTENTNQSFKGEVPEFDPPPADGVTGDAESVKSKLSECSESFGLGGVGCHVFVAQWKNIEYRTRGFEYRISNKE